MKGNLSFLVVVVLAICLVGFAFEQFAPARTAHAVNELQQAPDSLLSPKAEAEPLASSTQPAVYIVIGLIGLFFAIMAVFPLLVEDPTQVLREADRGGQVQGTTR